MEILVSLTRIIDTPSSWDGGWGRAISTALPYFPAYNSDGSYYVFPKSTNPVTEANEKRRRIFTQRTMASYMLTYR